MADQAAACLKKSETEKIDQGVWKETLAAGTHKTESRAQ
jgi:hypothetical protein